MNLSDFHYELPEDRIAQQPLDERSGSRMLVVYRDGQSWEDRRFGDLPEFLRPGDCVVVNDSKVLPARLYGHRKGFEGQVEVLLVRSQSDDQLTWLALARPGRKLRTGEWLHFSPRLEAEIIGRGAYGERLLRFRCEGDFHSALAAAGHVPLPPYIRRSDTPEDQSRYQTVFARNDGSVAAPTAGLHFTDRMIADCERAGAQVAPVTLHVGLGTFQPLRSRMIEEVKLHAESFLISPESAAVIRSASRVLAVGTTSVRTIESAALTGWDGLAGDTSLFIYPGFTFQRTNLLLTNFHLPESSLLVLVCAFGGTDLVLAAYRHAVQEKYRFYSYGDCMLIV